MNYYALSPPCVYHILYICIYINLNLSLDFILGCINVKCFRKIRKQNQIFLLHSNIEYGMSREFVKQNLLVCFQIKTGPFLSQK